MISNHNTHINFLLRQLREAEGKRIRLILKNGFHYTTSNLLVLDDSQISFNDLNGDKITCNISMVDMVTEVQHG